MDAAGVDDNGTVYQTPEELWERAAKGGTSSDLPQVALPQPCVGVYHLPLFYQRARNIVSQWYEAAVDYWDRQEASDNGVLGGYGHLSSPDVRDSRAFLRKVRRVVVVPPDLRIICRSSG